MFRSSPGVHQHPQTLTLRKAIGTNREKHPGARGGTAGILNHCHPTTTKNPQNPDTRASKASGAGVQKQPGLTPYRAQGITQSQVDGTQTDDFAMLPQWGLWCHRQSDLLASRLLSSAGKEFEKTFLKLPKLLQFNFS